MGPGEGRIVVHPIEAAVQHPHHHAGPAVPQSVQQFETKLRRLSPCFAIGFGSTAVDRGLPRFRPGKSLHGTRGLMPLDRPRLGDAFQGSDFAQQRNGSG